MTKHKTTSHYPWKPILYGLLALTGGIALLSLSQYIKHQAPTTQPASTAPAAATTAPASPDQPTSPGPGRLPRRSRPDGPYAGLSNLLLLFGAASLLVFCVCMGWLVVKIRNSRPAWQRQTKFPKMRE